MTYYVSNTQTHCLLLQKTECFVKIHRSKRIFQQMNKILRAQKIFLFDNIESVEIGKVHIVEIESITRRASINPSFVRCGPNSRISKSFLIVDAKLLYLLLPKTFHCFCKNKCVFFACCFRVHLRLPSSFYLT